MKMMNVQESPILRYMIGAATVVIVVFGLKFSSVFLGPVFFASTLAMLFTPLLRWLEKKGLPPALALLVLVLSLGGFIILLIIIVTASLEQLSLRLPVYQELLIQRIDNSGNVLGNIDANLQAGLNGIVGNSVSIVKSTINIVLGVLTNSVIIIMTLFLLLLMLIESKSIATKFQTRLQTGNNFVVQLGNYTKQIQKQYRIQATSNLFSAAAITVELLLFRVDFAVLWGFLAFILGFIPNVGLIIATLPAIIIALILYGWETALAILIIGTILNNLMDNAVTPRIMGKGLDLPIVLVYLSFLFWSWVFGFIGALLAVPATLFVKTLLQGRQEARFVVVLLSGQGGSDTLVNIPEDRQEVSDTKTAMHAAVVADEAEAPPGER